MCLLTRKRKTKPKKNMRPKSKSWSIFQRQTKQNGTYTKTTTTTTTFTHKSNGYQFSHIVLMIVLIYIFMIFFEIFQIRMDLIFNDCIDLFHPNRILSDAQHVHSNKTTIYEGKKKTLKQTHSTIKESNSVCCEYKHPTWIKCVCVHIYVCVCVCLCVTKL